MARKGPANQLSINSQYAAPSTTARISKAVPRRSRGVRGRRIGGLRAKMGTQGKLILAAAHIGLNHPFKLGVVQAVAAFDPSDQGAGLGALSGEGNVSTLDVQLVEPSVGGQACGEVVEQRHQRWLGQFAPGQVLRRAAGGEQLLT